ncbi:TPA: hypothetical protein ACH3X1_014657 [Trebouxia sp. C0004]
MDLTEAIDVDIIPDTQDASASDQAAQSSGKVSSIPCLKHGVKKDPKGHFFAHIDAILTHVKDCPRRSAAIKQSAATELRVIRDKEKRVQLLV